MFAKPKNRKIAVILAFAGAVAPIAGWHKFYMGQPLWGALYILLSLTPIPRIASAIEGAWYLTQDSDEFNLKFNAGIPIVPKPLSSRMDAVAPEAVSAIADAVRQLDQLRNDGLISEYEFEQKRRQLLDRIA
jgi:TM2 domain-containing membrane protein YozV